MGRTTACQVPEPVGNATPDPTTIDHDIQSHSKDIFLHRNSNTAADLQTTKLYLTKKILKKKMYCIKKIYYIKKMKSLATHPTSSCAFYQIILQFYFKIQ